MTARGPFQSSSLFTAQDTEPPVEGEQAQEDQHPHFAAADGYYLLRMFEEVHAELDLAEAIPELQLEAKTRRLELLLIEERWHEAVLEAQLLCDLDPEDPIHFINHAFALQELGMRHASIAALLIGPESIKYDPGYHFALAGFEAEEGRPEEALHHLSKALDLCPELRRTALDCPLLAPLVLQIPKRQQELLLPPFLPLATEADPFLGPFDSNSGIDPDCDFDCPF